MPTEEFVFYVQLHQLQSSEEEGQVEAFCVCFCLLQMRDISEVDVSDHYNGKCKVRRLVRSR